MVALSACTIRPAEEDYPAKIAAIRAAKDESFKNDQDSPIPPDKKATLLPLAYFPIDESYTVPAALEPSADRSRIEVPTSIGKIRQLERIGNLELHAVAVLRRLRATELEVRFDQIDTRDPRLREQLGHSRRDLSRPAPEIEDIARLVAPHHRELLRPDRVRLGGKVPDHRLVRHLPGLRGAVRAGFPT